MQTGRWLRAGAIVGSVALGGAVGAVVFSPLVGSAAESGSTGATATSTDDDGTLTFCAGLGSGPIAVAADAIGIRPAVLVSAIRDGSTIAGVAREHDVQPQVVVDALVADAQGRLDQAVQDGRITQDQADSVAENLEARMTDLVNGELPAFPGVHLGGPGWLGAPSDATGDATTDAVLL